MDYVFLSRRIAPYLTDARYDHDRQNGNVSDHDPLIVEMMAPAPSLMHRVLRRLGFAKSNRFNGFGASDVEFIRWLGEWSGENPMNEFMVWAKQTCYQMLDDSPF
ncbi:hypothetical protein [Candidatus Amarolinea dominans]|uniref:hypothetical protein n=1 Tax=Candidatus Amarolinea dominans TaxID=3140696 RepID=UPI001D33198E|nr:hypothetical protein [Anaerolineae bacterium]